MATLLQRIAHLETHDLIRRSLNTPAQSPQGELEYLFRHALVQDAAYASILRADRKRLHRDVGEVLEALYPTRMDELAPVLAYHFDLAGDVARAGDYYAQAATAAHQRYALEECAAFYRRALELLQQPAAACPLTRLAPLFHDYGRVLELTGHYPEALVVYETLEALAVQAGDRLAELNAMLARATPQALPTPVYDRIHVGDLLDRAAALARELGEAKTEAQVYWNQMLWHKFSGRAQQALVSGERAMAIALEHDLQEPLPFLLQDLAMHAYFDNGRVHAALDLIARAQPLWRARDNRPMLADNLNSWALVSCFAGKYGAPVMAAIEEGRALSVALNNTWNLAYGLWPRGLVYLAHGDYAAGIATLEACLDASDRAGFYAPFMGAGPALIRAYSRHGDYTRAVTVAERCIATVAHHMPGFEGWPLAELISAHLRAGHVALAESTWRAAHWPPIEQYMRKISLYGTMPAAIAEARLAIALNDLPRAHELHTLLTTLLAESRMDCFAEDIAELGALLASA